MTRNSARERINRNKFMFGYSIDALTDKMTIHLLVYSNDMSPIVSWPWRLAVFDNPSDNGWLSSVCMHVCSKKWRPGSRNKFYSTKQSILEFLIRTSWVDLAIAPFDSFRCWKQKTEARIQNYDECVFGRRHIMDRNHHDHGELIGISTVVKRTVLVCSFQIG
jgi:hypothetical protein